MSTQTQTPWRYGKPGDSSVEEEISTLVLPVFGPLECKFSSGGREDKDVRMLGGGRPFTLELVSAKRTLLAEGSSEARASRLRALEIEVNARAAGRVCVSGLRLVEKEYTDAVKVRNAVVTRSRPSAIFLVGSVFDARAWQQTDRRRVCRQRRRQSARATVVSAGFVRRGLA
eukprot:SAG11_NODE_720_length_7550_cov_12.284257_7_plen_172_part_00